MSESTRTYSKWWQAIKGVIVVGAVLALVGLNVKKQQELDSVRKVRDENRTHRDEMVDAVRAKDDFYEQWSECRSKIYYQEEKFRRLHSLARNLSEIAVPHPDQILAAHFISDSETERTIKGYVPNGRHQVQIFSRLVDKPSKQLYFMQSNKSEFERMYSFDLVGPRRFEFVIQIRDTERPDQVLRKREFGDQVHIEFRQELDRPELQAGNVESATVKVDMPRIRILDQASSLEHVTFFPNSIIHMDRKWEKLGLPSDEFRPPNFLGKNAFVFIGKSVSGKNIGIEFVPVVYSDNPLSISSETFLDLKGVHGSWAKYFVGENEIDQCDQSFGPYGNIQLSGPVAERIRARPIFRISNPDQTQTD